MTEAQPRLPEPLPEPVPAPSRSRHLVSLALSVLVMTFVLFASQSTTARTPSTEAVARLRSAQDSSAFTQGTATVRRVELDLDLAQGFLGVPAPAAVITFTYDAPPFSNIVGTQRISLQPGAENADWRRVEAAFPLGASVPVFYDLTQPPGALTPTRPSRALVETSVRRADVTRAVVDGSLTSAKIGLILAFVLASGVHNWFDRRWWTRLQSFRVGAQIVAGRTHIDGASSWADTAASAGLILVFPFLLLPMWLSVGPSLREAIAGSAWTPDAHAIVWIWRAVTVVVCALFVGVWLRTRHLARRNPIVIDPRARAVTLPNGAASRVYSVDAILGPAPIEVRDSGAIGFGLRVRDDNGENRIIAVGSYATVASALFFEHLERARARADRASLATTAWPGVRPTTA